MADIKTSLRYVLAAQKQQHQSVNPMRFILKDICFFVPLYLHSRNWHSVCPLIIILVPEDSNIPININDSLFLHPVKPQKLAKNSNCHLEATYVVDSYRNECSFFSSSFLVCGVLGPG